MLYRISGVISVFSAAETALEKTVVRHSTETSTVFVYFLIKFIVTSILNIDRNLPDPVRSCIKMLSVMFK